MTCLSCLYLPLKRGTPKYITSWSGVLTATIGTVISYLHRKAMSEVPKGNGYAWMDSHRNAHWCLSWSGEELVLKVSRTDGKSFCNGGNAAGTGCIPVDPYRHLQFVCHQILLALIRDDLEVDWAAIGRNEEEACAREFIFNSFREGHENLL